MKRVMIVGQPGAGKSTLARLLGEVVDLPVHHMDRIHWQSGWVQRPTPERLEMVRAVEESDAWIFEGGFSMTYVNRRDRADTLIWVDTPLSTRLWRVTWRFVRDFGKTRPDMADGCPEGNFREMLAFYAFIWRTRKSSRAKIERLISEADPNLAVHILRNRNEVERFLGGLRA